MTGGALILLGDFSQLATTNGNSYLSTGSHSTVLQGAVKKKLSFATPGRTAVTSRFGKLALGGNSTVDTLLTDVVVDTLLYQSGTAAAYGLAGAASRTLAVAAIQDLTPSFSTIRGPAGFTMRITRDTLFTLPNTYAVDTTLVDSTIGTLAVHRHIPTTTLNKMKSVVIEGFAKLLPFASTAAISGDLMIRNNGSFLLDSGETFNVAGNLATGTGGVLRMLAAAGSGTLNVKNATFAGGSEAGLLVAGALNISGNFTQGGPSVTSFVANTGLATSFNGSGTQQISFANPDTGFTGALSSFSQVTLSPSGIGVPSLLTDLAASDSVLMPAITSRSINGGGAVHGIFSRGAVVFNTTLTQVRLVIKRNTNVSLASLGTSTFTGAYGAFDPLQIIAASAGLPTVTSATLNFSGATTTGCLARVNSPFGLMTVNLTGSTPIGANAAKGSFCQSGSAVLTWP